VKPFYATPAYHPFAPARGSPDAEEALAFARQAATRYGALYVVWTRQRRFYRVLKRLRPGRLTACEEGGGPAGSVRHGRTHRLPGTQRDRKRGGAADEAPPRPRRMHGCGLYRPGRARR
jgi:hypothetical protein